MTHEEAAVTILLPSRVEAALMDMGTGKSHVLLKFTRLYRVSSTASSSCARAAARDRHRFWISVGPTLRWASTSARDDR
jgi:hypothetical protein